MYYISFETRRRRTVRELVGGGVGWGGVGGRQPAYRLPSYTLAPQRGSQGKQRSLKQLRATGSPF